jgi:hypothetical protein
MSISRTKVARRSPACEADSFSPQTPRGRRFLALRQKIIVAGIPLLTPEEIEEETQESLCIGLRTSE